MDIFLTFLHKGKKEVFDRFHTTRNILFVSESDTLSDDKKILFN